MASQGLMSSPRMQALGSFTRTGIPRIDLMSIGGIMLQPDAWDAPEPVPESMTPFMASSIAGGLSWHLQQLQQQHQTCSKKCVCAHMDLWVGTVLKAVARQSPLATPPSNEAQNSCDMAHTAGLLAQLAAALSKGGQKVAAIAAVAANFKRWVQLNLGDQHFGCAPAQAYGAVSQENTTQQQPAKLLSEHWACVTKPVCRLLRAARWQHTGPMLSRAHGFVHLLRCRTCCCCPPLPLPG